MSRKIDLHFDSAVLGMSLLTITPGFNTMGLKGIPVDDAKSPDKVVKATIESATLAIAGVCLTRSWLPLFVPVGYFLFSHLWDQSIAPVVNESVAENPSALGNDYYG